MRTRVETSFRSERTKRREGRGPEGRAVVRARRLAAVRSAGRRRRSPGSATRWSRSTSAPTLVEELTAESPEIAFVAMHGHGGEDGTVQELLEILGIPFTGPGVAACIRCIDKALAKHEMRAAGVPTPDWLAFNETAFRELGAADALDGLEERLGYPAGRQAEPRRLVARGEVRCRQGGGPGCAGLGLQLRRPGTARALRRRPRAGRQRARRRAPAGGRGDPDRRPLRLRGPLRDRPHQLHLPRRPDRRRRRPPSRRRRSEPTTRSAAPASPGST